MVYLKILLGICIFIIVMLVLFIMALCAVVNSIGGMIDGIVKSFQKR